MIIINKLNQQASGMPMYCSHLQNKLQSSTYEHIVLIY